MKNGNVFCEFYLKILEKGGKIIIIIIILFENL